MGAQWISTWSRGGIVRQVSNVNTSPSRHVRVTCRSRDRERASKWMDEGGWEAVWPIIP